MKAERKPVFDHSGSSFDSYLKEEGNLEQVEEAAIKRVRDWQRDRDALASAEEGIRQGLEDSRAGRVQPAREFFAEFERKHPKLK